MVEMSLATRSTDRSPLADPRVSRILCRRLVMAVAQSTADRWGLAMTAGLYLIVTAVLSGLWRVAAELGGGDVVGYSAIALTFYIAATEAVTIGMPQRLIEEIGTDIEQGVVHAELLRPAPILALRLAEQMGRVLPRVVVCLAMGVGFGALIAGSDADLARRWLAVPAIGLAVVANLLAQHAFAAIAFWFRDAKSAWFLYQKLVFVGGGMLLPLEVLPDTVATIAKWMPFAAMAYVPGRLAAGFFEPALLLTQLGWIVALAFLASFAFARGERHLTEVGG